MMSMSMYLPVLLLNFFKQHRPLQGCNKTLCSQTVFGQLLLGQHLKAAPSQTSFLGVFPETSGCHFG